MQFNERDILTDILMDTKDISKGYHTAVLESANERVRNVLIGINNEEMNSQKQIFDIMFSRGWYPVDPAFTGTPLGPEALGGRSPEAGQMGRTGPPPGAMGPGAGMGPY
jgi:hypothetical protein